MKVDKLADVRMHPVTLSFRRDLEQEFLPYYNQKILKQIRFAFLISVFFDWIYVAFDDQLLPTVKLIEEFFTYYIYLPFIFTVLLLTFYPPVLRYLQAISSGAMVIRGIGTIWLMTADVSAAKNIYTGLLLIITFGFSVLRLRFIYLTLASLIILIGYLCFMVLPYTNTVLFISLLNNGIDIALFTILGMLTTYSMERYARTDFIQNLMIENEREKAADAMLALEKERVSREIHDGISSEFTGILAFTEKIKSNLEQNSSDEIINHIENSARRGLQELRNIMMAIGPEIMTLGYFVAYTKRHACDLLTSKGIEVEVEETLQASDRALSPQIILTLFRITQEACHNILKHSKADTVRITFRNECSWFELELADNGLGFSADAVTCGNGMNNMRKRAEKAGGEFKIISSPNTGTSIQIRLPLM